MPLDIEKVKDEILTEFKSTYEKLNTKTSEQGEVINALKAMIEEKGDTTDLEDRLKGYEVEVEKLSELADDLEKKMNRGGTSNPETKTMGEAIVGSDEFKSFVQSGGGRQSFDTKAILTADVVLPTSTTYWGVSKEVAPMVVEPRMPTTIRSLFPQGRTSSNAIEFMQWARGDMKAAPVAEGRQKPESTITKPTLLTVPIRTIAHILTESKQLMDDSPAFQTIIDQEMRRGLAEEENTQLLLGDGTEQNLTGIIPNASTFDATDIPGGGESSAVDVIRWAKLKATQKYYPADTVVLNPEDWAKIELQKSTTDEYLFSAFASGTAPRLWGLRVIEDFNIPAGKFLVGGFATGARIWDREQANLVISTEDKDNIQKNMITIRAEERLALTVYMPNAFQHGDLAVAGA